MRVGDRVRRISHNSGDIRVGEIYTIRSVHEDEGGIILQGGGTMYGATFFELVEEETTPETTLYSFVFRDRGGMLKVYGYETEEEYNRALIRLRPTEPLKRMKLRVTI